VSIAIMAAAGKGAGGGMVAARGNHPTGKFKKKKGVYKALQGQKILPAMARRRGQYDVSDS